MLERIIRFAIAHRWLMLLLTLALIALGVWSFTRLPIDAVPDITNVQVQINTEAPGYSPLEAEQRITFPIETRAGRACRGSTTRARCRATACRRSRSCSRTAPTSTSRASRWPSACSRRARSCRRDSSPSWGPIATGLGEIFMYTVEAEPGARKPDGTPWTPTDLRTLQDWVVRPQLRNVPGVTEVNTIGGFARQIHVTPGPGAGWSRSASRCTMSSSAVARNNQNVGAGYIERNGQQYLVRVPGQVADLDAIGDIVLDRRDGVPIRVRDVADGRRRPGAAHRRGDAERRAKSCSARCSC